MAVAPGGGDALPKSKPNPQPKPTPQPSPTPPRPGSGGRISLSSFLSDCFSYSVHHLAAGFGYVRKHWRGALQVGIFAACLISSVGACILIGIAGALLNYIGDSRRDRNWTTHAPALIENGSFTILMGYGGKVLEGGKVATAWKGLFDSPWARFGKHAFEGDPAKWDYTGNAILAGGRAYFGLVGVAGVFPDPTPGPHG